MTFRKALQGAVFSFLLIAAATGATRAATVDFTGNNYNMGLVADGQTGVIKTTSFPLYNFVTGLLPSETQITFSYAFRGGVGQKGKLGALATYLDDGYRYTIGSDGSKIKTNLLKGVIANVSGADLPVTIATDFYVDPNDKKKSYGTITIVNMSAVTANFASFFKSFIPFKKGHIEVTYAVSAVPLPAALPLFGIGLAGLAGFARSRKRR